MNRHHFRSITILSIIIVMMCFGIAHVNAAGDETHTFRISNAFWTSIQLKGFGKCYHRIRVTSHSDFNAVVYIAPESFIAHENYTHTYVLGANESVEIGASGNANEFLWVEPQNATGWYIYDVTFINQSHNYKVTDNKPATCVSEGYINYTCKACNFIKQVTIPLSEHLWGEWEYLDESFHKRICETDSRHEQKENHEWETCYMTDIEPTCTEGGLESIHCTICHTRKPGTETVIPANHNWEESFTVDIPATCTTDGSQSKHCTVCGEIDESTVAIIPAPGHSFGDWAVTTAATCSTAGEETRTCQHDATHVEKRSTDIDPEAHAWGDWVVTKEPTCVEGGEETRYCGIDPSHFQKRGTEVDHEAHAWGEWVETKVATCTTAGEETKTCQHDATHIEKRSTDVDPEAHDWDEPKWTWSKDNSSASAKFTCRNDSSHTETMNAEVTSAEDDSGNTVYTAKVIFGGKEYTDTFPKEEPPAESKRIYGASRYDTAIKAADEYQAATGSKFENVIVAYGKNFPDALSGGYLAKVKNAPILLVEPKQEDRIADYISENIASGGKVYILGGEGAVSSAFESKVEDRGIYTERLGGATRYETNLKILEAAEVTNQDILVCTGTGYADSLSASAVGKPILLVGKTLTDEQKTYIKSLSSDQFYLIGGEGAVNTAIEKGLKDLGYSNIDRIAGASRYETSTEVANRFFPSAKTVVLAYAKNFPDGLSGGPLAMKKNAPIILTDSNKTEAAAKYVKKTGALCSITLGGTSLISDIAVKAIMG